MRIGGVLDADPFHGEERREMWGFLTLRRGSHVASRRAATDARAWISGALAQSSPTPIRSLYLRLRHIFADGAHAGEAFEAGEALEAALRAEGAWTPEIIKRSL